jgi:hypothetical protein
LENKEGARNLTHPNFLAVPTIGQWTEKLDDPLGEGSKLRVDQFSQEPRVVACGPLPILQSKNMKFGALSHSPQIISTNS